MQEKLCDNNVQELTKKLLINRKHGCPQISKEQRKDANEYSEGYKQFMNSAKTEREVVVYAVEKIREAGFTSYEPGKKYQPGDRVYSVNRGKAILLAVIGRNGCRNGVHIAASHIDSPRLDLKPHPLFEKDGMSFFKTHYYGGIKKYQWTAIPLAMHGRIFRKDGSCVDIRIGEKAGEPQFCVTDLLPHLADKQMEKSMEDGIDAEKLSIVIGSWPISEAGESDSDCSMIKLNVMRLLYETYGITEEDFVSADIEFVPAFQTADVGFDRSMIGGYAQDDRVCAYPELTAILATKIPEKTAVAVLADREEIGSDGNTGLNSRFLSDFIADLAQAEGLELRHVLAKSQCLSADVAAAYDPNYSEVFEANNSCYLNGGIGVEKYTGGKGKSRTSEATAEFISELRQLFERNGVLWQMGENGKIDAGGSGTVAKFIAALNVDVIDIGVPVLSMHSPFELVSKLDLLMTYRGICAFFQD